MNAPARRPRFALIHSPLVGPTTWALVAEALERRGYAVTVPALSDDEAAGRPYWQQHAESAAAQLAALPPGEPLVLAGHSGAGVLLPPIRQALGRPVAAYLFVDAGLPPLRPSGSTAADSAHAGDESGEPRLDPQAPPGSSTRALLEALIAGERFPTWSDEDLREDLPDESLRRRMLAELHPRDLPFWQELIPTFAGWPDAPCGYLLFSPYYATPAEQARAAGWPMRHIPSGHFHMLVDAEAVAEALVELAAECGVD